MGAIGETLRRQRERRNLGLDQISRELKISARFLEAIEEEQFDKLPGGVFAKSFVRQYARLLGLDEDELAAEVQRAIDPPAAVPQFAQPSRPSVPAVDDIHLPGVEAWKTVGDNRFSWSSSLPAFALVVVVMLVCSGVYAWWQRQRSLVSAHVETPPPVQAPISQPQSSQPEPLVPPPPAAEPAPAEAQPQAATTPPVPLDRAPAENPSTESVPHRRGQRKGAAAVG